MGSAKGSADRPRDKPRPACDDLAPPHQDLRFAASGGIDHSNPSPTRPTQREIRHDLRRRRQSLQEHDLPPLGPKRHRPARDLARPLAEFRRRRQFRGRPRRPSPRLRPRCHAFRPRQQLRPAAGLGRGEFRPHPRRRLPSLSRRTVHLLEGRLGHVAGPLRRLRLAQVPDRQPRPEPEADGPRLCRPLLPSPPRPEDADRGIDGRARCDRPPGQGALCRHLELQCRTTRGRPRRS